MSKRLFLSFSLAIALGLVAAVAPGHWVLAQDTQTEGEEGSEQKQQQQNDNDNDGDSDRTETEQSASAEDNAENDAESGQQNTLDGFVPSEQISEDLSVSFPVDI